MKSNFEKSTSRICLDFMENQSTVRFSSTVASLKVAQTTSKIHRESKTFRCGQLTFFYWKMMKTRNTRESPVLMGIEHGPLYNGRLRLFFTELNELTAESTVTADTGRIDESGKEKSLLTEKIIFLP